MEDGEGVGVDKQEDGRETKEGSIQLMYPLDTQIIEQHQLLHVKVLPLIHRSGI